MIKPRVLFLLLLIVLLAFALRLYRLDTQELWGDESVSVSARRLSEVQVLLGKTDVHPPLYFITLRTAMLASGASLFAVRFVSVFWSVLLVPLAYRLGRRTMKSAAIGILAALVTAISALQVLYAQEARMYAMATAWAAALLWCTVEILRRATSTPAHPFEGRVGVPFAPTGRTPWREQAAGEEGRVWLAFILTSLIGMYTHYFVAFVVIAQGLALLWAARRNRTMLIRLAIAAAVVAAVYAPWIPIQRQYAMSQAYTRWDLLTPGVLADVVKQTLTSWSVARYNVIPTKPFPGADWGTVIVSIVAFVGAIAALRTRRIQAALMPLTVVVVLVLGWAINPILPVFQDRYLMIGTPAYLLLVAAGLNEISDCGLRIAARPWLSKALLVAGLLAVVLPQSLALRAWFTDPSFVKGEYGKAMAFISTRAQPGDVLLLNNYIQWGLFDYYRPGNVPAQLVPAEALTGDDKTDGALSKLTAGKTRAWLVEFGYAAQYDPDHRAERWLAQHGYKQLAQDFIGLRVNLYVLGAAAGQETPAHRLDAKLGAAIQLIGYTLESDSVRTGDNVRLTLFWQATDKITARYTVFTHLVDSTGRPVAQTDSPPLGGTAPTDAWQVGAVIIDRYAIALRPDTAPGQYELRVGMYTWPDLTRLPVTSNDKPSGDYVLLASVRVTP
jgi:mannosyltransferase